MTYTHMQRFKVNGQSVPKICRVETNGRKDIRTDAIALPLSLMRSVIRRRWHDKTVHKMNKKSKYTKCHKLRKIYRASRIKQSHQSWSPVCILNYGCAIMSVGHPPGTPAPTQDICCPNPNLTVNIYHYQTPIILNCNQKP